MRPLEIRMSEFNRPAIYRTSLVEILRPGFLAVRRNWLPMLILQLLALALVIAYYQFPSVRDAVRIVSSIKESGGVWFALISGAVAGGVLPQIAKIATGRVVGLDSEFWAETAYSAFVFAIIGVEVDTFYRWQTVWFGNGIDGLTLVKKTALDMFVFSPILFVPTGMILFHLRSVKFHRRRIREIFTWPFYKLWVLPLLPFNWAFWIPVVMCVYSLPDTLQFPFSQISEACWSIFFVFMANEAASS